MLSISFAFCLYTVLCRSLHYTVYITTLKELCCLIFYKNALLKEVHLKDTFAAVDICARSSRAISIFLMARFACSNCLNDACALQFSSSVTDSQLEWDRGFDWSISTFNFFVLSLLQCSFCLFVLLKYALTNVFLAGWNMSPCFSAFCTIYCSLYFSKMPSPADKNQSHSMMHHHQHTSGGVGSVSAPHASLTILAGKLYLGVI